MTKSLEFENTAINHLQLIMNGYETGDFTPLFPCLSQDCVMESQWVMQPNVGYNTVTEYLSGKGKTLKNNDSFPICNLCELIGNLNPVKANVNLNGEKHNGTVGIWYPSGELCLVMQQTIDGETNEVILRIEHDENAKISRIDLCMPEFYNYRCFWEYVDIHPITSEERIENNICIIDNYYDDLHFFLRMVDEDFDEYEACTVPMDKWLACLRLWDDFYSFDSFDEAFEKTCGVDYSSFTAKNEDALKMLLSFGEDIWENRKHNRDFPKNSLSGPRNTAIIFTLV